MALSGRINGSCTGTAASKYNLWIDWSASQSIQNNCSYVNMKMYVQRNDGYSSSAYNLGSNYRYTRYDGGNESGYSGTIDTRNNVQVLLQETNYTTYHNSDGSRSVNLSGGFSMGNTSLSGGSVGETVVLDTIPREAYITNSVDFTIGNSIYLTFNNPANFSLKLHLYINSQFICEKWLSGSSGWLTFTQDEINTMYSKTPNSNSAGMWIGCAAMNGSTQIGSWRDAFGTCYVANSNPTFSDYTYADTNAATLILTSNNQLIVQSKSTIRVTCNTATPRNYATISKYTAQINGRTVESSTTTIDAGTVSQNDTLIVSAVDSRGNTTSVTKSITVISYSDIALSNVLLIRTNNISQETTLSFNGTLTDLKVGGVSKNDVITARYRYKATTTEAWGSWNSILSYLTKTATTYSLTRIIGNFDIDTSYNFEVYTEDKLGNKTVSVLLVPGKPLLSYRKGMIGINKIPTQGSLDIDGDIYTGGGALMPTGAMIVWTTDTIPVGWLKCVGTAVSRTTYSKLFAVIGTQYGTGDGSTTFNVPEGRTRAMIGKDPTGWGTNWFDTLGKMGGEPTHTLSYGEMPTHSHSYPGHWGSARPSTSTIGWNLGDTDWNWYATTSEGSSTAHNNMPPYTIINWIVKYC